MSEDGQRGVLVDSDIAKNYNNKANADESGVVLPKTKKAYDSSMQITLSSAFISGVIPKGAAVKRVRTIAGAGTSIRIREAERLSELYGGDPVKWEKKGGIVETDSFIYDVHWYELNGVQYEQKIKLISKAKT